MRRKKKGGMSCLATRSSTMCRAVKVLIPLIFTVRLVDPPNNNNCFSDNGRFTFPLSI